MRFKLALAYGGVYLHSPLDKMLKLHCGFCLSYLPQKRQPPAVRRVLSAVVTEAWSISQIAPLPSCFPEVDTYYMGHLNKELPSLTVDPFMEHECVCIQESGS